MKATASAPEARQAARQTWAAGRFADIALLGTTTTSAHLTAFAGIRPRERILDVGTGTGLVAITAARQGAEATGVDITPELLEEARRNAEIAGVDVAWHEADAQALPFPDAAFDVVVSQFGHMFAPHAEATARELVRVTRPGGRIAFSTWPPDQFVGRSFALNGSYLPPTGADPPGIWGEPQRVRELLGPAVTDLHFETGVMTVPALSPAHYRLLFEERFGPVVRLVQHLGQDPARLAAWWGEYEELIGAYFTGNAVRQEYLMTRGTVAAHR